ncbi:uncharacterized protein LOC127852756 isoform X2 [Dreissena polymorpha]|uniref:uncharacterized protein LOC127852756 isoform X2 n=1 Tax=Dreissena polymorpha TaxID=45954 RepID=UPI0022649012|nr:uncharacterized protein LOC127852756 isoform X2 [Dreissena polymorpha]
MASLADVYKDKERTNWLKACLAIGIAKSGLKHLADNEAQNFHRLIYSRVGSTCNSCSTKNLMHHKPCPRKSCDKVCQEIIKEHRYNSLFWKNTSAQLWQTNYWEIAKCYFPPDGYAATSSIRDTDFNGVISFMLNCRRFDSSLSFRITTGKPTNPTSVCLLYKAREIGKAVRHSSVYKVTDVELLDYFTTLSNLLNDSCYLIGDSDAQKAVKKLEKLKKDTLLLTTEEMMCFLDAVDATLKKRLKDVVDTSLNELRENTALCIDEIEDYIDTCKLELEKEEELHKQDFDKNADKRTKDYNELTVSLRKDFDENADKRTQEYDELTVTRKKDFDENAEKLTQEYDELTVTRKKDFDENADKRTLAFDEKVDKCTQDYDKLTVTCKNNFDENADKRTQDYDELTVIRKKDFDENAEKLTQEYYELTVTSKKDFDENADKRTLAFDEKVDKCTQDYDKLTVTCKNNFDENADKRTQDYDELTVIRKKDFDEKAEKLTHEYYELTVTSKQDFKENAEKRKKDFDENAEKRMRKINEQCGNTSFTETSYKKSCEEIQTWLIKQYRAMCVVPVSMLDPDIDVPLERIYVPPSIKALKRGQDVIHGGIEMDKSSTMESDVNCYKELLHRDGNPVNTIYIQGDPGCGKTTFSTKLVLDWCNAHSENDASTKKKRTVTTRGKASNRTGFSDLDTLRDYKFLFFVSLRDYSGTMCNVSQMVVEAIQSNKLPWDDSVWEHKCIVLTDAADEWYHPDLSYPPPRDYTCRCGKDQSMPLYLQRNNITNIITARPWKLANRRMSDSLTCMFQISGVANYETLARNVINVLAEKNGISQKATQSKCNDFFEKLKNNNMRKLMTIPAICVQLVHQFYVGRLMEDSLCSIYINMLDMHIAKGLHKLQIEDFDTETICVKEIKHIFETGKNEYMSANGSLIRSACALAFKTLTDSSKESSLVFAKNTITNHMTETQLGYLLQTGIITQKKSLALSPQKNIPYMFVHKTIQEFLASMHIAINQTGIEDIMSAIQSAYCDGKSILDIGQLFIFTCGMCAPVAERMSKHMMDVITSDMESKLLSISDHQKMNLFSTPNFAQRILLGGFIERLANKQPCLQLTLTHIALDDLRIPTKEIDALNTLIDMNISNITSMDAQLYYNSQQKSNRVQEIISQSRESLSYLRLRHIGLSDLQLDLQGLKLKSLSCSRGTVLSNLDCTYMRSCSIALPTPLSERRILQSMSITGKNITRLQLMDVQSINLLCAALPKLTSLHTLIIYVTNRAVTLLGYLPESIRKVVYFSCDVSAQDVKSMVEWSKSRDACVRCELLNCVIPTNETDSCNWMKQQDGIDITQCEFKENGTFIVLSFSWSTILSK